MNIVVFYILVSWIHIQALLNLGAQIRATIWMVQKKEKCVYINPYLFLWATIMNALFYLVYFLAAHKLTLEIANSWFVGVSILLAGVASYLFLHIFGDNKIIIRDDCLVVQKFFSRKKTIIFSEINYEESRQINVKYRKQLGFDYTYLLIVMKDGSKIKFQCDGFFQTGATADELLLLDLVKKMKLKQEQRIK